MERILVHVSHTHTPKQKRQTLAVRGNRQVQRASAALGIWLILFDSIFSDLHHGITYDSQTNPTTNGFVIANSRYICCTHDMNCAFIHIAFIGFSATRAALQFEHHCTSIIYMFVSSILCIRIYFMLVIGF